MSIGTQFRWTKNESLEKIFSFVLPGHEVRVLVEDYLKRHFSKKKIPGFREGHAPVSFLFSQYGSKALHGSVEEYLEKSLKDAIDTENLMHPIQYDLKILNQEKWDLRQPSDVEIEVSCAFRMKTPDLPWEKMEIQAYEFSPLPEDVQTLLEKEAANSFKPKALETPRPAAKGDFLKYTMTYAAGQKKDTLEGIFRLGFGSAVGLPPEFEEELIGIQVGHEISDKARVPKHFNHADLAGQKLDFSIRFHEILEAVPHAVDEEFAKSRGVKSVEEMEENIRKNLLNLGKSLSLAMASKEIRNFFVQHPIVEISPLIVDKLIQEEWEKNSVANAVYASEEDRKEAFQKAYGQDEMSAKESLKKALLAQQAWYQMVQDIAKRESLKIGQEEIGQALQMIAREENRSLEDVVALVRSRPSIYQNIMDQLREEKVLQWMMENLKEKGRLRTHPVVGLDNLEKLAQSDVASPQAKVEVLESDQKDGIASPEEVESSKPVKKASSQKKAKSLEIQV